MGWHDGDPIPADHKDVDCQPRCAMCRSEAVWCMEVIESYATREELVDFIADARKNLAQAEEFDWDAFELENGFARNGLTRFVAFATKLLAQIEGLDWDIATGDIIEALVAKGGRLA